MHAITRADRRDEPTRAELQSLIGGRNPSNGDAGETVEDHWFIAGRRRGGAGPPGHQRDMDVRKSSRSRWARVLRFAPVPQTIIEPWPLGATIHAPLKFQPGLHPLRATAGNRRRRRSWQAFAGIHEAALNHC